MVSRFPCGVEKKLRQSRRISYSLTVSSCKTGSPVQRSLMCRGFCACRTLKTKSLAVVMVLNLHVHRSYGGLGQVVGVGQVGGIAINLDLCARRDAVLDLFQHVLDAPGGADEAPATAQVVALLVLDLEAGALAISPCGILRKASSGVLASVLQGLRAHVGGLVVPHKQAGAAHRVPRAGRATAGHEPQAISVFVIRDEEGQADRQLAAQAGVADDGPAVAVALQAQAQALRVFVVVVPPPEAVQRPHAVVVGQWVAAVLIVMQVNRHFHGSTLLSYSQVRQTRRRSGFCEIKMPRRLAVPPGPEGGSVGAFRLALVQPADELDAGQGVL